MFPVKSKKNDSYDDSSAKTSFWLEFYRIMELLADHKTKQ